MREPSECVIIARNSMPVKSPAMAMLLEPFKVSAAEGAAVELKLRLLAGTMPALQKYAHQRHLEDIEGDLARHFGDSLSPMKMKSSVFPSRGKASSVMNYF